jgi:queuine/archaeosine tRNA-ribosyltransferase
MKQVQNLLGIDIIMFLQICWNEKNNTEPKSEKDMLSIISKADSY